MKAETVEQYKILQWMRENFMPGSLKLEFTDRNRAIIIDKDGETAVVECDQDLNVEILTEEEA